MPLNKLENFIKNSEGRILYVNPNDLDATDGIENQGNSLTKPFKTIQRALLESARFSYLRGNDNDITEKTTILLFPGEHLVDNRPGFGIRDENGVAKAISPTRTESGALNTLTLTLNSNFDLTQEDNLLYKFNSTEGGVIVPRGTSIVGLDLRKTKIRPKYVPNPTDDSVKGTAIFRVTGACYFWQFSIFDGDENTLVYTDPNDFSTTNQSKPVFSHHKLTVFEYADGVNPLSSYGGLTDLDVYYSKLSNAYNRASGREIDQKFPTERESFAKQRPEYEIVGAFNSDRIQITSIISGDGATPGQVVTVTTAIPHQLTGGTPIKIEGVNWEEYNISTKVQNVLSETQFTYLLSFVPANLAAGPASGLTAGGAEVSVEVDTVSGASPYIFNCSLRSVYGMNGMKGDGAKATGFRSMVVAQFTGISLQKDDRAFVKYIPESRSYEGITYQKQTGELLSSKSSAPTQGQVYHLDKDAVYREGWKTAHITVENDAVFQVVSVFAIGYHIHFSMKSGGDASITNSNSNFGQFALTADGFKKEAFKKDDKGFITSIIAPKAVVTDEANIELLPFNKDKTKDFYLSKNPVLTTEGSERLYILGQTTESILPTDVAQGFRIGARIDEKITIPIPGGNDLEAFIVMPSKPNGTTNRSTDFSSEKIYEATHNDTTTGSATLIHKLTMTTPHHLNNGESIRIIAESGDLPEGLNPHQVYFAITNEKNATRQDGIGLTPLEIQIAASKTNAEGTTPVFVKTISNPAAGKLKIISRVSDKIPGDIGHPMQFDSTVSNWYIHVDPATNTYTPDAASGTSTLSDDNEEIPFITRRSDNRSLDDKLYKIRYVIPKELQNARDPNDGFIIQDSSFTNVRFDEDFTRTSIGSTDYDYNRNLRFISYVEFNPTTEIVTIRSDKKHNLNVDDQITVKNVISDVNVNAAADRGYNGVFLVENVINDKVFTYKSTDILGVEHDVGNWQNDIHTRNTTLPRFERTNNQDNLYIYRTETISPYIEGAQDGVFHLFVLNGNNAIEEEFTTAKYNQNVVDLYPQLDRDNINENPQEAQTYAKRFPIGDVVTNDLKKSITRETTNKLLSNFGVSNKITTVNDSTTTAIINFDTEHEFNGLRYATTLGNGGSGYADGTYHNIKIFDDASAPSTAVWKGATAKVVVTGGSVTDFEITEPGSGYKISSTASNNNLYFDSSLVAQGGISSGGGPGAFITIAGDNVSSSVGHYVQVTGITTGTDHYFRINDVPSTKSISINKTANETILEGQQVIGIGPVVECTQTQSSTSVTTTFICTTPHGLLKGNRFRVLDTSDNNLGDFIVESVVDVNNFTAVTRTGFSQEGSDVKYILKHGLSAHDAQSGKGGESLGVRGVSFFSSENLKLTADINSTIDEIPVQLLDGSTTVASIQARFPLGCYIQIDNEILRVVDKTIGTGTKLKVIRGTLGTIVDNHFSGSSVTKIKPLPVELRRPSILRASGHTFEYLGYGPGNYSTGLPQVQLKTLTEREEFLSQSQETSCGTVVYTGMNDKGDFYIGNTKISSDSGEQVTFDIPVPTVTGEDPSTLSVVFDEVIIKERLLVEGGSNNTILSQFDGPVTFNGPVRFNNTLVITGEFNVTDRVKFTSEDDVGNFKTCGTNLDGAFTVKGGVSIGKKLQVGDKVHICSNADDALSTIGGVGIGGNLAVTGTLSVTGTSTFNDNVINAGIVTSFEKFVATKDYPDEIKKRNSAELSSDGGLELTRGDYTGAEGLFPAAAGGPYIDFKELRFTDSGDKVDMDARIQMDTTFSTGSEGVLSFQVIDDVVNLPNTRDQGGLTARLKVKPRNGQYTGGVEVDGELDVTGDITAFASSDERFKDDIVPIPNALDKVLSISGNTFKWNNGSKIGQEDTGVIAQEIEKLELPGVTTVRETGTHAVNYEKLVPLLIESIKELSGKVDNLEKDLKDHECCNNCHCCNDHNNPK